jgi:hypothetical protein
MHSILAARRNAEALDGDPRADIFDLLDVALVVKDGAVVVDQR